VSKAVFLYLQRLGHSLVQVAYILYASKFLHIPIECVVKQMIREDTKKRARKQIYLQFLSASAEYLAKGKVRKASEKG
jgi:hypothetical protein